MFALLDATIRANYANFGFIPYGQTIMGKLHYLPGTSFCEEVDESVTLDRTKDITPFMMV